MVAPVELFAQILRVSWTHEQRKRRLGTGVLEKAEVTETLWKDENYDIFGHVIRTLSNCLEKTIQGTLLGSRKGKDIGYHGLITYSDVDVIINEEQCIRTVEDRQRWRRVVDSVASSRIENCLQRERERERCNYLLTYKSSRAFLPLILGSIFFGSSTRLSTRVLGAALTYNRYGFRVMYAHSIHRSCELLDGSCDKG